MVTHFLAEKMPSFQLNLDRLAQALPQCLGRVVRTDRAMARGHYLRSVVDSMYHKFSLRFAAQMAEAEAFIEKLNASLVSQLVDTEVVEKLNAGLKSYHERDIGEKHA